MTAHLESTKDYAEERKKQLKMIFEACSDVAKAGSTVIFGGDLNIRDKEVMIGLYSHRSIDRESISV